MLKPRGFTLIELCVGLGLVAFLTAVAVPNIREMMASAKVRATASMLAEGIQLARVEAVKRNNETLFVRNSAVSGDYQVCEVAAPGGGCPGNFLILSHDAGNASNTSDVTIASNALIPTQVRFNALGRLTPATPIIIAVSHATMPIGSYKPLSVVIGLNGSTKMCDPSILTVGDSRSCL